MQNRVAYTNPHAHPEYIGGVMIPAGETREIDATHHPDYRPSESGTAAAPQTIVEVLLAGDVATLLAHIPALGADDLQALSDREQSGARRENVLSALAEQLLTLASAQVDSPALGAGDVQPASAAEQPKATGAKATAKKAAGA